MPCCPNCNTKLECLKSNNGIYFLCRQCSGRFVSIPVLRREKTKKALINEMWSKAKGNVLSQSRRCPHCGRSMSLVNVEIQGLDVSIDVCMLCYYVWFDPGEYDCLPRSAPLPPEMPVEVKKALAMLKVEHIKERYKGQTGPPAPDSVFDIVLAAFGLPVEIDIVGTKARPWVTWTTVALCFLIFLISFTSPDVYINTLGFIPAQWYRWLGFTFLSSFFLHANIIHLIGNMYFLIIFGDNVEDTLGRKNYIILLLAAHIGGIIIHGLFDPNSTVPCIGASAGISGVLAYYVLVFPHARIGMLFFYKWFRIPVSLYFLGWIFTQIFIAMNQVGGSGSVSGLAHLGGVAVGIIAFIYFRYKG